MDLKEAFKMNLSALRGQHLTKINSGAHRDAYRINSHHFDVGNKNYKGKIIKYDEDLEVNVEEINTWQHVKGTRFEEFFCPIRDISSDRRYILMDKVDILGQQDGYMEIVREIQDVVKQDLDVSESDAEQMYGLDIHYNNIGYHSERERYVLIDYPWGGRLSSGFFLDNEDATTIKDIKDLHSKK